MSTTHSAYASLIATLLSLPARAVAATLQLRAEGATIPFISRYRKELTGNLDEVQVTAIFNEATRLEELDKRKDTILKTIEEQGQLTDELRKRIEACYVMSELEDIYLPYKPKRRTRATVARERGLEPLAELLTKQEFVDIELLAERYLTDEVPTVKDALAGARDIVAEWLSENEKLRNGVRRAFEREAIVATQVVKGKEEEGVKYKDYFEMSQPLAKCPSHRFLAMRRGEREGFLKLGIEPDAQSSILMIERMFVKNDSPTGQQVKLAIADSYKRLVKPSIETEFGNTAKEKADKEAIEVFAGNLRQLLLAAPLGQKNVLAIDPGFRTGCKVVCLDAQGNLLTNTTIFPHPPENNKVEAAKKVAALVEAYKIDAIAIGNGTAGRETETFVKNLQLNRTVQVFVVSEDGASIYSASAVAREEFPDYDITVRGAVSIGRRLMDPLAELVKIDPKSIGVGQYQHDVDQNSLKRSLDQTVESCVNSVGVNVNTASKHLLTYVSGLGPQLAQNIVEWRRDNGAFTSRKQLNKVPRLGAKAYEQCAAFLRIPGAQHPLDNSAVHPESYSIVERMARDLGCTLPDLLGSDHLRKQIVLQNYVTDKVGMPTLVDIMKELAKPGLDPRKPAKVFEFAADVHTINDLQIGMVLPGIVTNITNFGAFVDVGVKQDGLVHISQLAQRYVSNPSEVVKLHQHVQVRVADVDIARSRIQLSMIGVEQKLE